MMGLSPEELELQTTELLPARDVMQGIGGLDGVLGLADTLGLGGLTGGALPATGDTAGATDMVGGATAPVTAAAPELPVDVGGLGGLPL